MRRTKELLNRMCPLCSKSLLAIFVFRLVRKFIVALNLKLVLSDTVILELPTTENSRPLQIWIENRITETIARWVKASRSSPDWVLRLSSGMEYEYSPISIQGAERLAKPHGKRFLSCLPWLISLTLAVLLVLQFPHQKGFCQAQHDFASGYKTEFGMSEHCAPFKTSNPIHNPIFMPHRISRIDDLCLDPVKQNIVVEEIEFHLPYIPGNDEPFDPPMYEYVGAPSARLDKAWQKLLFGAVWIATLWKRALTYISHIGLNLDLAEEEAITIKDDTFQWNDTYMYYSGYISSW